MKIKKYYLTKSLNTRRMEKLKNVKNIVITSSKYRGFSAIKNRNIIEMNKYKENIEFSVHYIIGINGEIINIIPDNEQAIITRNNKVDEESIGVMLCLDKNNEYAKEELLSLKQLVNSITKKYNINKDNILMEYNINSSRRPVIFVDENILLDDMLGII